MGEGHALTPFFILLKKCVRAGILYTLLTLR